MKNQTRILQLGVFAFLTALGSVQAVESGPVLVPTPDPGYTQSGTQIPVAAPAGCTGNVLADIYTVKSLDACGQLAGVVSQTWATVCNGRECNTGFKARQIRRDRRSCCACSPQQVQKLIYSLEDVSFRVRNQAVVSLDRCGYCVEHTRACVSAANVPSTSFTK